MKKPVFLILTMSLLFAFTKTSIAQQIIKADKEIYSIDGAYNLTSGGLTSNFEVNSVFREDKPKYFS